MKDKIKNLIKNIHVNVIKPTHRFIGWYILRTEKWKWDKRLTGILKTVPEKKKNQYTTVLDLQHKQVLDLKKINKTSDVLKIDWISMTKQILDNLTILDIVGCQPMSGPVDIVHWLKLIKQPNNSNNISLQILKDTVEAYSRKFQAKIEFNNNATISNEIIGATVHNTSVEITHEHLTKLKNIAEKADTYSLSDDPASILLLITKISNKIGLETRRGVGNRIVVSPATYSLIKPGLNKTNFVEATQVTDSFLRHVGTLNSYVELYVDILNDDNSILIGYKGISEVDTGYIFSPYIMVIPAGIVLDPTSYEPQISLMTRYGVKESDIASSYYKVITVSSS